MYWGMTGLSVLSKVKYGGDILGDAMVELQFEYETLGGATIFRGGDIGGDTVVE